MFCDSCGSQIAPGQQFCGVCGKRTTAPAGTMTPNPLLAGVSLEPVDSAARRVQTHIHLLGILWIAYSALLLFAGLVVLVISHVVPYRADAPPFISPLLTGIAVIVLSKGAFCFAAGWGLMHRLPWARVLAIVMGILALLSIPFGTALGVFTLWVLLPAGSDAAYRGAGFIAPGRPV